MTTKKKRKSRRPSRFVVIGLTNRNVFPSEREAVGHAARIVQGNYAIRSGCTELVVVKVLKTVRVANPPVQVITEKE